MKAYDFDACTYEGVIYCTECLPDGVDENSEGVHPIFANSEWDAYPCCDACFTEHDYVDLTDDGRKWFAEREDGRKEESELDDQVMKDLNQTLDKLKVSGSCVHLVAGRDFGVCDDPDKRPLYECKILVRDVNSTQTHQIGVYEWGDTAWIFCAATLRRNSPYRFSASTLNAIVEGCNLLNHGVPPEEIMNQATEAVYSLYMDNTNGLQDKLNEIDLLDLNEPQDVLIDWVMAQIDDTLRNQQHEVKTVTHFALGVIKKYLYGTLNNVQWHLIHEYVYGKENDNG